MGTEEGLNLEYLEKILGYLPNPDRVEVSVFDPPMPSSERFQKDFPGLKFSGVILAEPHHHIVSGMDNAGIIKLLKSEREDRWTPFGTRFSSAEWNHYQGSEVKLTRKNLSISYQKEPEFIRRMREEVSGLELTTTQTFDQTERFYTDDVC